MAVPNAPPPTMPTVAIAACCGVLRDDG
jgi:hypothetical protein